MLPTNGEFTKHMTRKVFCGGLAIGGDSPVSLQTMTKTDTRDVDATVRQILSVVDAGAEAVRLAIPDSAAASAFGTIRKQVSCPLIADIHFDHNLALQCLRMGADKVRVNPGNLGGLERLLEVADGAKAVGACIRVGINSGSVEKDLLSRYGGPTPEAMVESAVAAIRSLEDRGFENIVISLKSSSVKDTVRSCILMAQKTVWPLHLGVTEAGPGLLGVVKSTSGIASLLTLGIGDTVRVTLTGTPESEIEVGRAILQSVGARTFGPDLISCPTCGRTQVDLIPIVKEVSQRLRGYKAPIKVAVMGCPVNGPGEAKHADVGVACGREGGILFVRGEVVGHVPADEIVESLMRLVDALD